MFVSSDCEVRAVVNKLRALLVGILKQLLKLFLSSLCQTGKKASALTKELRHLHASLVDWSQKIELHPAHASVRAGPCVDSTLVPFFFGIDER